MILSFRVFIFSIFGELDKDTIKRVSNTGGTAALSVNKTRTDEIIVFIMRSAL